MTPNTTEMVERVARAIAGQQFPSEGDPIHFSGYVDRQWRLYRDHARAAIQEMREPTEVMIDAQINCCLFPSKLEEEEQRANLKDAWSVMIDTALSETGR